MTDTHKTIQYNLRITEELRERLKKSADFHNRSMNADIVARLEQTFTTQTIAPVGIAPPSSIEQKLDKISQDITDALSDIMKEIQSLKKPLD